VPWPWLVIGALATAGTIRYIVTPEIRAKVQRDAARQQFETLEPPQPDGDGIIGIRGSSAALLRACLYRLARSPQRDLSAQELTDALRRADGVAASETKVRSILRENAAFVEPSRGRFQLGRPASTLLA
jgi:hypothetical protein